MTVRRFRLEATLEVGATLELPPSVRRHAEVLRLGSGDEIVLFDGHGAEADAVLVSRDGALAARVVLRREAVEPWHVTLLVGLPKAAVLDQLLRGATEAGVSEFVFFEAARSTARVATDRLDHKLDRYRRILEEAARQSERAVTPSLIFARSLEDALDLVPEATQLVALDAREGAELLEVLASSRGPRALVLGPEGGLTAEELDRVRQRGGLVARASLPVLRVETAAVVLGALAVLAVREPAPRSPRSQMR